MTSVTFPPEVGGDGSTVSDDENADTGLRKGGYTTRFVAALVQMVAVAQWMLGKAQEVASLALNILNAPATSATSSSNLTLAASGTIAFTLDQMDKAFMAGMTVGFARLPPNAGQQMIVRLDTFEPSTGVGTGTIVSATATGGPYSGWNVFRTASGGIPATRAVGVTGGLLTGGGTLAADFFIGLPKLSADEVAGGTKDDAVMTAKNFADAGKAQALTYAANIAWPMQRRAARVVLTGNGALQEPTGEVEGAYYDLTAAQDATGGRLLSFAACYEFENNEVPDMPTAPGAELHLWMKCLTSTPTKRFYVRASQ